MMKPKQISGDFMNIQYKISILMGVMLLVVFGALGLTIGEQFQDNLENQMGFNAMDMAVTIAALDEVEETLAFKHDYRPLHEKIEKIKSKTRFQYIIVMDMNGIQYSYPYNNGLGKAYKNGGEERVLSEGEAYVSADRNVLISAIRAFTPVYYEDKQVGAVLVGLLTDKVHKENAAYLRKIHLALIIGGVMGLIGALLLAKNIKKSTYGLEPKEIALLLGQREIILESLKLGILAVDNEFRIVWINQIAIDEFGISRAFIMKDVRDYYPKLGEVVQRVMQTELPQYNEEIRIHSELTLMSSHTITRDPSGEISGVVTSFENMTKVKKMAEELIGYKKMTSALRAQNHEFMNKLQTISGLIQLEEFDEALDFISEESKKRLDLAAILTQNIKKTHVAAILLAKYNQVTEAKYDLEIDMSSRLENIPTKLHEDELCSIIGNLIDNAQEAFSGGVGSEIKVKIVENVSGILLQVKDDGPGIHLAIKDNVFDRGITTKASSRGLGLNIVKDIVDNSGGSIQLESENGTLFTIEIPWDE